MIVNGARLTPDPLGGLYYAAEKALIVSDLHLEKGSSFAQRGVFLPPYDTDATLDRLDRLVALYDVHTIVCLGDSVHDDDAPARLAPQQVERLNHLSRQYRLIWIAGNHDPMPPKNIGGEVMETVSVGTLHLRHIPQPRPCAGEVAGHLHPKAAVIVRSRRIRRACFVTDGVRLIMPAFGAYTGGLDVLDPAVLALFPGAFFAHMLGRGQVHPIPSQRLRRER